MSNMPILIILVLMLGTIAFGASFWIGLGILAVTAWLAFVVFGASLDSMFDTPDGTNTYTGTSTSSPITVSELANGFAYTCTVTATNSVGTSSPSAATDPITPEETASGRPSGFCMRPLSSVEPSKLFIENASKFRGKSCRFILANHA